MIEKSSELNSFPIFDFDLIARKEQIIFFDIETTGLSPGKAFIYLIGAVIYEDGKWLLRQYFAESFGDETGIIGAFFGLINERRKSGRVILISYNGDGFDIPFLNGCIRNYGLGFNFDNTVSLDLFKSLRPYRKFTGLKSLSLKSVEIAAGISREDAFSGGDLIKVYEGFLTLDPHSDTAARGRSLDMLLLHNAEDIADMPFLMNILGYEALFTGAFTDIKGIVSDGVLDIHARLRIPLLTGFYSETDDICISISEEDKYELNIAVTLFEGRLKYFFGDYKEYYYLPEEDMAVHKSVGQYVSSASRRRATARTCYQYREGLFIPESEEIFTPVFKTGYGEKNLYGDIGMFTDESGLVRDPDLLKRYIISVLKRLK